MQIQIGIAKINKYASSESGDTVEVVERPNGGMSVILADGQRSGKSAKQLSNIVVRKVVSLLAEGVRDGAAARAASDYLFSQKGGKVQSTLNILSVDLDTKSIVITRNNPLPVYFFSNGKLTEINEECKPVGIYKNTRPNIYHLPLSPNTTLIAFSDGLEHAGIRNGKQLEIPNEFAKLVDTDLGAQKIADSLMNLALEADKNRPVDDISIVAIKILPKSNDNIRRLTVDFPSGK